jgi:hypothetical protein
MKRDIALAFLIALVLAAGLHLAAGSVRASDQAQACLHGDNETPDQRGRRQAAIGSARQINTAESRVFSSAGAYSGLSGLPNVAPPPAGFEATVSTDGATYTFSVKDRLDPCHFALFSDQDGLIYNATPLR